MLAIRICVADPDPSCAELFRTIARRSGACVIVAECTDAVAAHRAMRDLRPDVLIADAGLAPVDGFSLLREAAKGGAVGILTTSNCRDAVRAFTESAADCMLKPLDIERCRLSLSRARRLVARAKVDALGRELLAMLGDSDPSGGAAIHPRFVTRLTVSAGGRSLIVPAESIEWIGAEDCYSRVYADSAAYLIRQTLGTLARRLDPTSFIRPHRSAVVNVTRVSAMERGPDGGLGLLLTSGIRIPVSQRRRGLVADRLADRSVSVP